MLAIKKMKTLLQSVFTILTYFTVSSKGVLCKVECKASGIICPDPYTYQFCVNLTDYAVQVGTPRKCPEGTICDNTGLFACKVGKVVVPTTTQAPTTMPSCSGPSKHPTRSCNTYLECIRALWWWQPETKTCPDGQNFNPTTLECVSSEVYSCGTTVSTTTPAPQTPKCSGSGNLPGPRSDQYYECQFIFWMLQWRPQLKSCPKNQIFDAVVSKCVEAPEANKEFLETTKLPTEELTQLTT